MQRHLGDLVDVRGLTVESIDAALFVNVTYVLRETGQERTVPIEWRRTV